MDRPLRGTVNVRFVESLATGNYHLYLFHVDSDGRKRFAKPVEIEFEEEPRNPCKPYPPALFELEPEVVDIAINNVPHQGKQVLAKSEQKMQDHIDNLSRIIKDLINK